VSRWPTVRLGDVLSIRNGFAFDSKQFGEDGKPLIRIRDLKEGSVTKTRFSGKFDPIYVVKSGDLLVGMDGEFRCHRWRGEDALMNQRVCRLESFSDNVSAEFVEYGLNRFLSDIEERTTFTTVKHLSAKDILAIEFPLPPLNEQKRIVAKLDQVSEDINRMRVLRTSKSGDTLAFQSSLLNGLVNATDPTDFYVSLGDLTSKIGSGATPRGGKDSYLESGISLIRSLNVHDADFRRRNLAYISSDQAKSLANVEVVTGDVLLNITGASIARTCKVPADVLPARVNQHVAILRARHERVDPDYLALVIVSKDIKQRLLSIGEGAGTTRQALTKSQLSLFSVRIPGDLHVQKRRVAQAKLILSKVTQLERIQKESIELVSALKTRVLATAFAGDL
jgi:type I restriction enzyme S subunit